MKTYEYTVWGVDRNGKPWITHFNRITDSTVSDSVIVLRRKLPGVPYFEKGFSLNAIEGWEAKEEVLAS